MFGKREARWEVGLPFACHAGPVNRNAVKQSLLIVEPDLLTRWSLQTYLDPWFEVHAAAEPKQARQWVGEQTLDALIVSDAVSGAAIRQLEQQARLRNPSIRIVRTVAAPATAEKATPDDPVRIEKPFDLRQLRKALGVPDAPDGSGPQ